MPAWKRKSRKETDGRASPESVSSSSSAHALLSAVHDSSAPLESAAAATTTTTTETKTPSPDDLRRQAKRDAAFGPLGNPSHLYRSLHHGGHIPDPVIDEPPYFYLLTTYISFLILIFVGHVQDYLAKWFTPHKHRHLMARDGYAPIYSDFDSFYTRRLKLRINDCFDRPTTGVPGRYITLLDRETDDHNHHFRLTGTTTDSLNLSSYNYLGFAQSEGPCSDFAEETVRKAGISMSGSMGDAATSTLHIEVERQIARFVGKDDALVFSMGFVTNATTFPALVDRGCLILSDELNHASIRFGSRLSGASIRAFKHNNMADLEQKLRDAISQGQPRTHRPWKKILVTVEGLYSMEGTMVNLPRILELKKRYRFYLFVDEAHSIGAVGPRGRGVCDYFKVDPAQVDILMGTFTKSFGANGGYIAADKAIIDKLRATNAGQSFGEAPTPPVLAQILSALRLIAGEDPQHPSEGAERLQRLAFNSRYLRLGLKRLGFIVYGHDDAPIVPLMLYNPAKMPAFSHEMLKRKIAVVVVTYPATPLELSRVRFCVSAAHTKEDLDRLLVACDEVGDALQIKFSSGIAGGVHERPTPGESKTAAAREKPRWRVEEVIERGVRDVRGELY
ncbi:Serine palmitoyltransferase 2 [Talaromyces atroroseus]|uniref:Serine palmitoyltransferase 2 n=1 Tax=Talaromyces atroroseus TaxID=1441469 RepID=A0A225AJJ7_TALAT|nr:Serine palmitoyltransferase 2 [Talaromyces atroroseus]OKL58434.1 Serine palmitoyltransferase 2 [Talaromyces atroroseus]